MAKVKVATPVPGYTGSVGGVHFANGEALVDEDTHAAELGYFRASGYFVADDAEAAEVPPVGVDEEAVDDAADSGDEADDDAVRTPAKNAKAATWRAWAVEHGGMSAEEAGALSRDQLVERFAEAEENS